MFAFDNVSGALAHAVQFGATVVFNEDDATSVTAWCFDPDGNTFALHHRKREAKDGNDLDPFSWRSWGWTSSCGALAPLVVVG